MNNNEIIKFQGNFLKQVDNLIENKLRKYNLLSPAETFGIVDSINDAYSANIILAGTTTPQRIPTNPNVQFVEDEQVIVWYLNRDPRNKYVIAKCATGTEQTGGGSSGSEHDSVTVLDSNTIDFGISGQQITGSVKTQQSITSDTNGIKLSGDSASPGNSKYYGTNDSGTKGYHGLPTIPTNTSDLTNDSGFITSAQAPVQSVAGKTGIVTLSKSDVGLNNVDNTADSAKSVASATKLTTARTILLTGGVSGSVSFDGSDDVSITTTVADDSHNHVISDIDDLQDELDDKAPLASPSFTGTPTVPTPSAGDNSTKIATTAFVQNAVSSAGGGDMSQSVYDSNGDGKVDAADEADEVPWSGILNIPTRLGGVTIHVGSTPPTNTNMLWLDTSN